MPSEPIKYMPIREFIDLGFLQEVNRVLLHPCGLAMALHAPSDELTDQSVIRIWDYRDDPEGMLFGPGEISEEKISSVVAEMARHVRKRAEVMNQDNEFGHIQRVDSVLTPPKED